MKPETTYHALLHDLVAKHFCPVIEKPAMCCYCELTYERFSRKVLPLRAAPQDVQTYLLDLFSRNRRIARFVCQDCVRTIAEEVEILKAEQ